MENQKRLELVNSVNNAQLLGQKSNESSELKAGNRRKVIELPIVVNKLPISCG